MLRKTTVSYNFLANRSTTENKVQNKLSIQTKTEVPTQTFTERTLLDWEGRSNGIKEKPPIRIITVTKISSN